MNITSDGEISNALGNVVISDNLNVTGTGTNNIGVAGATNTILGTTTINSTGTAATTIGNSGSTVTVGSLSTALNSSVPSGYDRIVIANSDGRLEQASISAVVTSSAWGLSGNSTSDAWNGTTGSRLGTTSAQPLVLATTNATAQDIRFYTGNNGANERMRITGTGNVGIGTGASTPVGRLQVVGGAITPAVGSGTDAGIVWPADPGGGGGDIAWIKYFAESGENTTLEIGIANDSDDDISFKVGAVQVMSMQNTVVTVSSNLTVTGNTTLGNATTDAFTLTSSGLNVTSAGVISDFGGAVEITDALTVVGATNINATGTATTTIGNTGGTLTMTGSTIGLTGNVTANDNLSVNGNTTLGNAATDVFTLTSSGLNVTSDGVISDDGGAVEITDALTVVGATNINATGTAATTIGNTGATITLGSVSTTLNGSVPSGYDRVVIANSDGRLDQVSIASISGASTWSLTGNDPTEGTHFLGTTTGKRLEFRTNNVERMRIASDGNVSIGTTTTSHPLTVSGNATTSTLRGPLYVASNSDATNNGVSATLDATNDGGNIFSLVAGGSGSDVPGGFGIYQSGTAYRMAINTDGEVHIGALSSSTDHSSFGSTLNVRGNASIGAAYWDDAAPSNGLLVEGSVGIGNTSPSHKLDVTGTFRATGLITGDAGLTVSGAAVSINASSNFATDINTGTSTGAVTIGGSAAQTIDIGTGANNKTVNLGSTNGASTTTIYSGSGSLKLNVDNNQTTNINTGTSTGAVNIGTGSASGTVSIGRSDGTTTVIGTTSINASVNNATNINTGTSTGAVNIGNSGSTVTVLGPTNINTTGAQATTIGNTGATASILGGLKVSVKEVTTTGNHTVGNNAVVVVTGGMVADDQIQLPDISAGGADGRIVIIRNARTNTIDVATFAGVVVVDNLAADASVTLIAVGTAWYQIGN